MKAYKFTETKNGFIKNEIFEVVVVVVLLAVIGFLYCMLQLQTKSGEEEIISYPLTSSEGKLFKGWKLTPDLEAAIESGDVSLEEITVIEKGGEIEFEGTYSNKISVINYETVIEANSPKIYSDEYWDELCKKGENTYVLRTIGLVTESEGAE